MGILKSEEEMQIPGTYNAILDQGSEFEGKLSFEGTVRIDGNFKGEIVSDALLIVGENGHVEANVKVRSIVISGEVNGNVEATDKVEILAPGILKGNIVTPNLIIEEGVVFEGSCQMVDSPGRPRRAPEPSDKVSNLRPVEGEAKEKGSASDKASASKGSSKGE